MSSSVSQAQQRLMRGGFIGDIITELRKVEWPTFATIWRLSVVVIIFSAVMGVVLGGLDAAFTYVIQQLLLGGR